MQKLENPKKIIIKSNSLVEASYRLSIQEIRVVLLAISNANQEKKEITDKDFYLVTAKDYSNLTGIALKASYQELRKATDRLFHRVITISNSPTGEKLEKPIRTRWTQADIEYSEGEGSIEFLFSTPIIPYLSQLSKVFTTYNIEHIGGLKTPNSIRLYELLSQYRNIGYREIEISFIREALELIDSKTNKPKYPQYKELKRRIIDPAIASINQLTNLKISYIPIKEGRSVKQLKFQICDTSSDNFLQQNAFPGESYSQAKKRLTTT